MAAVRRFKRVKALAAESGIVVSDGAVENIHVLQAFAKTGTRKVVGDAKRTDSLGDDLDDWAGVEPVIDAFGLHIKVVSWYRTVVIFENPHFNALKVPI